MKNALKKITAYTWAFIAILVAFFTAGMFTLGSVKDAGDSVFVEKGKFVHREISRGVKTVEKEIILPVLGTVSIALPSVRERREPSADREQVVKRDKAKCAEPSVLRQRSIGFF